MFPVVHAVEGGCDALVVRDVKIQTHHVNGNQYGVAGDNELVQNVHQVCGVPQEGHRVRHVGCSEVGSLLGGGGFLFLGLRGPLPLGLC